ncbi:hypothetical protein ACFFRR_005507 [Megaselia abdita]
MENITKWKILENYKTNQNIEFLERKQQSNQRIFKHLSHRVDYLNLKMSAIEVMFIMKARFDLLGLNGNRFGENVEKKCSFCSSNLIEDSFHLVGKCSKYRDLRMELLGKRELNEQEITDVLDGKKCSWKSLSQFIKKSLDIRKSLIG